MNKQKNYVIVIQKGVAKVENEFRKTNFTIKI